MPRPRLILLAILLTTAAIRTVYLAQHLGGPLADFEVVAEVTDAHTFSEWAMRIARGDWLCRDAYHPYFGWMQEMAPKERFLAWWGGAEVYHQNPLYAYLLALSYVVAGSSVPLLVLQVLTSVLAVLLVARLGERLMDARAGWLAAALAAVFGPSVFLDTMVLRSSLTASVSVLSVWCAARLLERPDARTGLAAGLALAAAYMLRPSGLLLLVVAPAMLLCRRESRSAWRRWAPAFAAGAAALVGPFVVRNLLVGAPWLRFSTRGPETIIQANSRGVEPAFFNVPQRDLFLKLMDEGHDSLLAALRVAVGSWPDSSLRWWTWHEWQKLVCVFRDFEYCDNANYYFFADQSALLAVLPTFGWFVGLGLVGIVVLWLPRRRSAATTLYSVAVLGLLAGCLIGFALGRYRMPLAFLLTIPAGALLSQWITWAMQRRIVALGGTLAAAGLITALSFHLAPKTAVFAPDGRLLQVVEGEARHAFEQALRRRQQEHSDAARALHARGRVRAAGRVIDEYVEGYGGFFAREDARLRAGPRNQEFGSALILHANLYRTFLERVAKTCDRLQFGDRARRIRALIARLDRALRGPR